MDRARAVDLARKCYALAGSNGPEGERAAARSRGDALCEKYRISREELGAPPRQAANPAIDNDREFWRVWNDVQGAYGPGGAADQIDEIRSRQAWEHTQKMAARAVYDECIGMGFSPEEALAEGRKFDPRLS